MAPCNTASLRIAIRDAISLAPSTTWMIAPQKAPHTAFTTHDAVGMRPGSSACFEQATKAHTTTQNPVGTVTTNRQRQKRKSMTGSFGKTPRNFQKAKTHDKKLTRPSQQTLKLFSTHLQMNGLVLTNNSAHR